MHKGNLRRINNSKMLHINIGLQRSVIARRIQLGKLAIYSGNNS